jgi:hypothetical protein
MQDRRLPGGFPRSRNLNPKVAGFRRDRKREALINRTTTAGHDIGARRVWRTGLSAPVPV